MRKFVITTTSESGDHYVYCIEHNQKPTIKEIDEWLKLNGSDTDENGCYELVDSIDEVFEFKRL
jgi:hypothetical protein